MEVDRRIYDPPDEENDPRSELPRGGDVQYISSLVTRDPSFYDYRHILKISYSEVEIEIKGWLDRGFRPHVFLIGAALTREMIADIPHYDLCGAPKKLGLEHLRKVEVDVTTGDRRRRVGVYEIRTGDVFEACLLQAQSNRCAVILLAPDTRVSDRLCMDLYRENGSTEEARVVDVGWHRLARRVCGRGSVFIREVGMFDDLRRGIVLCLPKLRDPPRR